MAVIRLPDRFDSLVRNTPFDGPTRDVLDKFGEFVGDQTRGLPFFPEFTGHGVEHFQRVLDSASALIDESFFPHLTPEDVAVITTAVLLHDSAMHLTQDGFLTLLQSDTYQGIVPELDEKPWPELWQEYYGEASRWGDRTINSMFGESVKDAATFTGLVSPIDEMGPPDTWTEIYLKFIGEFIRRHHGRLAHEFAVVGVPGPTGPSPVKLPDALREHHDLCGVVARSHCMSLRATFPYLDAKQYGHVTCRRTHPVFLMVLLRIADYLDVDVHRVPDTSLAVRSLRSPFSRGEWEVHQCVREVRQDENDVEALFVVAEPRNISTFLKIRRLLHDVQHELDTSWAVLGEVYSRQGELSSAGIRLRRIRSNLDDLTQFARTVEYVPRGFAFKTAGAVLLQKLVGPLYADNTEVAIRELLQNAVDAVSERHYLDSQNADQSKIASDNDAEIRVSIDKDSDGDAWVTVEDFGVGMREDVLSDYFLTAGATFRESDAWKRAYVAEGHAQITRSGRFGIGVLAAFLLGERIEVTTRHHGSGINDALHFAASIQDDVIELRQSSRAEPGTTIRVRVDNATYTKLSQLGGLEWDWYRWRQPEVVREIDGKRELPKLTQIPGPDQVLPEQWHRIDVQGYDDVIWTFGRAPHLVCNGLNVGTSASSYGYQRAMHWGGESRAPDLTIPVRVPCVSVIDKAGLLPVDLQRFTIRGHKYPFEDELLEDVTRDFCAFCYLFAPKQSPLVSPSEMLSTMYGYPGHADLLPSFKPAVHWMFTNKGASVLNLANNARMNVGKLIVMLVLDARFRFPKVDLNDDEAAFYGYFGHTPAIAYVMPMLLSHLFGRDVINLPPNSQFFNRNSGAFLVGSPALLDAFVGHWDGQNDLRSIECRKAIVQGLGGQEAELGVWADAMGTTKDVHALQPDVVAAAATGYLLYCEVYNPRVTLDLKRNAFSDTWERCMPEPVIPYDERSRRNAFSNVLPELTPHVEKWEALKGMALDEMNRRFHREKRYNERL